MASHAFSFHGECRFHQLTCSAASSASSSAPPPMHGAAPDHSAGSPADGHLGHHHRARCGSDGRTRAAGRSARAGGLWADGRGTWLYKWRCSGRVRVRGLGLGCGCGPYCSGQRRPLPWLVPFVHLCASGSQATTVRRMGICSGSSSALRHAAAHTATTAHVWGPWLSRGGRPAGRLARSRRQSWHGHGTHYSSSRAAA